MYIENGGWKKMLDITVIKLQSFKTESPSVIPPQLKERPSDTNHINHTSDKQTTKLVTAKADTKAMKYYWKLQDMNVLNKTKSIITRPCVRLPNNHQIQSTHKGIIPLHPSISKQASMAQVFPRITNSSLILIEQVCDDNFIAVFDKKELNVYKNNIPVLRRHRNYKDYETYKFLQKINNKEKQLNVIVRRDEKKTELAAYLHACAFSPVLSTLEQVIYKGHLLTWPGIHKLNFNKLLKNIIPAAKGYLDQERKNMQFTKSLQDHDKDLFQVME